jgi:hypothetical protein
MAHVRDEEWVDFVRGTLAAERAAAIAAHLERGCTRCARAHDLWGAVVRSVGREELYTPPHDTVRVVRSTFVPGRDRQEETPFLAALVFDSLREARAAGVRGLATLPRHLLFQAGPVSIDLRLEASAAAARVTLIGQVADAGRPAAGATTCQVALLGGGRTLGAASTNRLGEFELEFAPASQLALLVTVQDRQPVHVPLEDVVSGSR